jgi:hypothetical protein
MKILLTLFFCLILFSTQAQQAMLKFENGTAKEAYITAIDSVKLTTSEGQFTFDQLQEVSFPNRQGRHEHLYFELNRAGVPVSFDRDLELTVLRPPFGDSPAGELEQFKESFREYKKAHHLGTGLQLAGVMLGAIGMIIESDAVIYTGMATAATGLIVELNAANKKIR